MNGEKGEWGGHPVEMITSVNISYVAGFVNLCNGENLFSELIAINRMKFYFKK